MEINLYNIMMFTIKKRGVIGYSYVSCSCSTVSWFLYYRNSC